jgi:F-type H+-transporting ATPase subunit epsilon
MFTLTLVTPEKKLVAGQEIEELFVPGFRGELNILPGHAPLLTTLGTGVLKYRIKGEVQFHLVAVSEGYCQVNPKGVNVLAETAERPEELDVARAVDAEKDAEKSLQSPSLDPKAIAEAQAKLARARTRREAAASATKGSQSTNH